MLVKDVYDQVGKVLGVCDSDTIYSYLNEAIEELSNLANWDPMTGYMDICTFGCEITLPDDVEVPLAINVGGHPADFRNKWFEFHLNGPGTECCGQTCDFSWSDKGNFPTFRDPIEPSQVAAYPEASEAAGTNIRVFGYDQNDKWIMTADAFGVLQDGFDVPVLYGMGSGMTTTQLVKRITRVLKPVTNGFVQLVALDPGSSSGGTLLGLFRPTEEDPLFRRIRVSGSGCASLCSSTSTTDTSLNTTTWVRMRFRKKFYKVSTATDFIPLHSGTAIKMMVMAIKKYEADLLEEYVKYFGAAREALQREQKSRSGPNQIKIQFQAGAYAGGRCDNLI